MDQSNQQNAAKPPPQHNRVLQEITGPLVFQCLKCRLIVGDSFAFVTADRELNSVVLYGLVLIYYGQEKELTLEGKYEYIETFNSLKSATTHFPSRLHSTYIMIYCTGCNSTLGKVWRTTPRKLDYIRDLYSLNLDRVMIYQLGDFIDPKSTPSDTHTLPSARMQQISINKLKDMILMLNERITTMEHTLSKFVSMPSSDSAASSTEGSNVHCYNSCIKSLSSKEKYLKLV
ncbi:16330_t:CDS:2 [Funneliformis geosporum]|uniref:11219_t:CDS:1 n=1 Tax=Funneliformis geosporum TaxID=1117311 RepID=A0A9W4WM92_9GLOM|nr:11219_t:CDS:2 [Funneliformis geosporum]CAI2172988.1 16330_t:CDS:2 [Funneliformis geosporum]